MTAYWPTGSTSTPRISDGYGPRAPINGSRSFHFGADVPMGKDQEVLAARDGVVIFSGGNGSLGQQVVIQTDVAQFLYPHNRAGSLLPVGARVKGLQRLANCGLTGNTTGYHSCFRVFEGSWQRDADARDPVQFMARLNGGAPASSVTLNIKLRTEGDEDVKVVLHRETGGVFAVDKKFMAHFTSMTDAQYVANVFTEDDRIIPMNTPEFQATLTGLGIPFEIPDRLRLTLPGKSWSPEQEASDNSRLILAKLGA